MEVTLKAHDNDAPELRRRLPAHGNCTPGLEQVRVTQTPGSDPTRPAGQGAAASAAGEPQKGEATSEGRLLWPTVAPR